MPHSAPSPDDLATSHRQALKRLREMGMDLAERLHAHADEPDADLGEIATKFARVARAVRQTIFLESRLADEGRRREEAAERGAQSGRAEYIPDTAPWWVTLRMTCAEMGEAAMQRQLTSLSVIQRAVARAPDGLREQVQERLLDGLDPNEFGQLMQNHEPEWSIAQVCRRLGLEPDWASFTDRDWGKTEPGLRAALIAGPLQGVEKILPPPPRPPPEAYPTDPNHFSYGERGRPPAWNA